jgi:hypothetical protein
LFMRTPHRNTPKAMASIATTASATSNQLITLFDNGDIRTCL